MNDERRQVCPKCATEMKVELIDDFLEGKMTVTRCQACDYEEAATGWSTQGSDDDETQ